MFKSLRWRLQVWHAVVLLTVLTTFGGVLYRLHWQTRMQQVDAELHRTVNAVMSQFRRLLPWPARRTRRNDTNRPDADVGPKPEQNVASRAEIAPNEGDGRNSRSDTNRSETDKPDVRSDAARGDANRPARPGEQANRERPFAFRDPGPLPAEFVQLFHGDEESRLYFVIWGKDGNLLQKSESAPDGIEYPNWHNSVDGLPVRWPRDRIADHIYREVIVSVPLPRPPGDTSDRPIDFNVLVGRSLEKDLAAQHQSGLWLITIGLIILAAGIWGGGWLSARAIRPMTAMTATAEAISAQNLSERINVQDTDSELGNLATVLNASFDRLQAAIERQRQFTADASHELRTPLSVIATHTELALARPRSNEDYRATIETCRRASQRMKSLIDSLLLLARFDSGTPQIKKSRIELETLLRDCVEMIEPLAAERRIHLECQTVPCTVVGDGDRLIQVVTNLLTNAIRYNVDDGSIRVTNRIEGKNAIISVSDTGVGIAGDQLPLIFDRFYQVDKARSPTEGSCGLGLAICKTIVEAHGGTITAISQLGFGTTLEVRLPIANEASLASQSNANEGRFVGAMAEV